MYVQINTTKKDLPYIPLQNSTVRSTYPRYSLDRLRSNINTLNLFLSLPQNWNDNNAQPFNNCLIKKCISIISELEYQPEIFPTARQSIQFEYEKTNGDYLEFEFFEEKIIVYMEKGEIEIENKLKNELEINKYLNEFYA